MFGAAGAMQKYMQGKHDFAALPKRSVTRNEFVKLATTAGVEDPERTAGILSALGGYTRVGDEMLTIEKESAK